MHASEVRRKSTIKNPARPTKRLVAPVAVIVFCFCAICGYLLVEARRATLERAAEFAGSLATSIAADISRNIETVDLSLQGVIEGLDRPEINRLDPKLRNLILFDRSAAAHYLGKIIVLDEAGTVRFDSKDLDPPPLNLADRDYFLVHKNNANVGLYIGRPAISRFAGFWFVGLSRRLSHADGSFAGAVVASLRLSYFEQTFKNIALGPDGNITLSRSDGIVLMRWPFKPEYIGLDLSRAKLFDELARSPTGRFESDALTDGQHRLFVYNQIGNLPLVIGVGQTTADIYAQWNNYAFGIAFMIAVLCAVTYLLVTSLMHDLRRRTDAEANLAVLAATDPLTGLSNRRHFNETLGREWQRGTRDRLPLALMMIDADNFKPYNDIHGHQAGDMMLKTMGAAIAAALKRGGDTAARYGGDEFAILLPATTQAGAQRVAGRVRLNLTAFCQRERITDLGLSIGIACVTPVKGMRSSELIELADQALYRAKHLGRNRTEVAVMTPDQPAAAMPSEELPSKDLPSKDLPSKDLPSESTRAA